MEFLPSNRDDIRRYYQGTYVKFKETGDQLFYIRSVDNQKVYGECENGDPFVIYLDEQHPYTVDYVLPHKSFFQYGPHAVMLARIPAKQYFRGINPENTSLTYMQTGAIKNLHPDFKVLKAFVEKQKFFNLVSAIRSDNTSCVLSPRMMYLRSNRTIHIDFVPVAKVHPTKLTIAMIQPVFTEEVKEFLRNTGEDTVFKFVELQVKEKEPVL